MAPKRRPPSAGIQPAWIRGRRTRPRLLTSGSPPPLDRGHCSANLRGAGLHHRPRSADLIGYTRPQLAPASPDHRESIAPRLGPHPTTLWEVVSIRGTFNRDVGTRSQKTPASFDNWLWLVPREGVRAGVQEEFLRLYRGCTGSRELQLPVQSDDVVAPSAVASAAGAHSAAGTPAHAIWSGFSPFGGGSVKGMGRASPHRGKGPDPCLTTISIVFLPIMA